MEKQELKHLVNTIKLYDGTFTLDDILKLNLQPQQFVEIEQEEDSAKTLLYIYEVRLETDEEYNRRMGYEIINKARQLEYEKEQYLKLKAKFEK